VIDFFASLHISCAFCTSYYGTIAIFKKLFYNSIEAVFLGWREYKGSKFNIMIEWENGEVRSEPLSIIAADDPVTCALYARDNNLLELDGWKRFK